MSINQFSSEIPQTVWWAWQQQQHNNHHQPPISFHSSAFKLGPQPQSSAADVPMLCGENREPMFQKTLTPSDVGKLNRLVIPKQHAEKYFPLGSFSGGGEATTEKGLLLTFEDELGKCWRFRYSYWNSSQSYVLTRGWSRFVKEKRLDAGDIVTFHRGGDRLFIGWRRRVLAASSQPASASSETVAYYHAHPSYASHPQSESCLVHSAGAGGDDDHVQETRHRTQTTSSSGVNQRRSVLRLFGVNMECHESDNINMDDDQPIDDDGSETLTRPDSAYPADQQQHHHHPF